MDAAINAAFESRVVAYIFVSAATVALYDTLLILPQEKEYIWNSKWTAPKALYIFTRYYGTIVTLYQCLIYTNLQHSLILCKVFFWAAVTGGGTTILALAANLILILRLNALYRSDIVRKALAVVYIGDFIINIYVMTRMGPELADNAFLTPPGLPIYGCLTHPQHLLSSLLAWIPCICMTVLLFAMMAYKLLRPESLRLRSRNHKQSDTSPLLNAFFRDTALYFLIVLVVITAGFVICFSAEGPYQALALPWIALTYSFAGSRLILTLRQKAALEVSMDSLPDNTSTMQVDEFVSPHPPDLQMETEPEPEHRHSKSRSSPPVSEDHGIHVIPLHRIINDPHSQSSPQIHS